MCEAGYTVCIGRSSRTNHEGARQLAAWLAKFGGESRLTDVRHTPDILHLKRGVVALDADRWSYIDVLADLGALANRRVLRVLTGDE